MLDKVELRIPYSASFRPDFRFVLGELQYAGVSSTVKRSQHYAGTCDLRPFGLDAILHIHFKWKGPKNHKLELLHSGDKSLRQMSQIIATVFDVDPDEMELTRIDFAADLDGIPVVHLYGSVRIKFKRSTDARGEFDYEIVGGRRLEYFRYGKSPNCVRVYDKPAECMARFAAMLKQSNPDAELPSFEDIFGFPPDMIRSRVERQAGGGRIPKSLSAFGQLRCAAQFNPFQNVEIKSNSFPFPDPKHVGASQSVKLAGIRSFIEKYGYQQARATLNCYRNAKRLMDDYDAYLEASVASTSLTVESILNSYQRSVALQIDGSIESTPKWHRHEIEKC